MYYQDTSYPLAQSQLLHSRCRVARGKMHCSVTCDARMSRDTAVAFVFNNSLQSSG